MTTNAQDYHFQSDMRQVGGVLMLLSFAALINPLAGIVSAFGPNGPFYSESGPFYTDPSSNEVWILVGNFCVFIWGTIGVLTGYMACVHDWSHKWLNIFMMYAIQTAWIGYIAGMSAAGQGGRLSARDNVFIPLSYLPNDTDVRFVGAMGILGIMAYGFAFAGSVAFMVWLLHAYTVGSPETRSGDYFKGRMIFYCGVLAWAGFIMFILGCWCRARFGKNELLVPVSVAMWTVSRTGIFIFTGMVQMFNGFWGLFRVYGLFETKPNFYQYSLAFQWLLVLCFQDIMSLALVTPFMAHHAPSLAAFSLGLSLMPAFLDHKRTSLPATFPADYYGVPDGGDGDGEGSHHKGDDIEIAKEAAVVEEAVDYEKSD